MAKMKLTQAAIDRLSAPKTGRSEIFDAAFPAFGMRVTDKGRKSWFVFTRLHKRQVRITLGSYPALGLAAARKAAREALEKAETGIDPRDEKRRAEADIVAVVVADWLARDQAGNRTAGDVKRLFEREILPKWGKRLITSIGRRDCLEIIDGIADRGAVTQARRAYAHLHRLFKWSAGRGIIESNPMADLPKPGAETKRERVLSDPELAEVWQASESLGWPFGPIVRLLILTGARREEIGALQWPEIDLEAASIALDGSRTKNGEPRTIPLSALALEIAKGLPRVKPEKGCPPYVFTTTGRTSVSGWSKAKTLLDKAIADNRRARRTNETMADWRLHDLRRTCATGLQRLGTRLEVIEAVLGHIGGSRAGVVGVYQRHAFEPEKRAALDAWARHVAGLASANGRGKAKVIPLVGKR